MKAWNRTAAVLVLASASLVQVAEARAQNASELMEEYLAVYQERLGGIDDLLMLQSVMGFTSETYYEKTEVDGMTVLQPLSVTTAGSTMPAGAGSSDQLLGDPSGYLAEFADQAEIDGTETIDGAATTVIRIEDLSSLELVAPGGGQAAQNIEPRTMRVFLDTEEWVVRRMEMIADATTPQGTSEVTADIAFSDFRDVAGMPYAHRMTVSIDGLEGAVSQEQLEQAQAALEQMRAQLENMSEEQRRMVENMMGGEMEQLMETIGSGSMTMDVVVEEIRVNEGPPQE